MSTEPAMIESTPSEVKHRVAVSGARLGILADIYEEETNLAVWQRQLTEELSKAAGLILDAQPNLQLSASTSAENIYEVLKEALGAEKQVTTLITDVVDLVEVFCRLFDLERVGLRLISLRRAMCPRFHVDNIPCRLLTTFHGDSTEWLAHDCVDRSKLGPGAGDKSDDQSGLFASFNDIQELRQGEVALLKGERWVGNEGAGLVHRSPQLKNVEKRLLLALDFPTQ